MFRGYVHQGHYRGMMKERCGCEDGGNLYERNPNKVAGEEDSFGCSYNDGILVPK